MNAYRRVRRPCIASAAIAAVSLSAACATRGPPPPVPVAAEEEGRLRVRARLDSIAAAERARMRGRERAGRMPASTGAEPREVAHEGSELPADRTDPPRAPLPDAATSLTDDELLFAADSVLGGRLGSVAYGTVDSMFVGVAEVVRLAISPRLTPEELERAVLERLDHGRGRELISSAQIELTDVMRAHLRGGSGFTVDPEGPRDQAMASGGETVWTWQVTPLSPGPQRLIVEVDALVRIDGTDRWRTVREISDTVFVTVSPAALVEEEKERRAAVMREAWDFVKNNAQWLWALVVAPAGLWVFRRLRQPEDPAK